ncbi:MAG TPA: hypothetical protein VHL78_11110, partial [Actinomycetota bacterium]|nr:hypothetical protein [Actinomycetota bacterium]
MRKRNLIVALAGVLSVLLLSPADARLSSSSGSAVAKLGLGDFKFWDHDTPAPTPCTGVELPECVEWTLEVTEPGGRLRVALDHPTEAFHLLDVIDPSGHSIASADDRLRSYGVGMTNHIVTNDVYYSSELFGEDAPVGRWSVRVTPPRNGAEVDFRMRAKLEAPRPAPKKKAALLPNLQVVPPYRFSFGCQAG